MRNIKPADANTIREKNLSAVLNTIREAGSISRADLVRQTTLSATTISSLVKVLEESGFVHESGIGISSGGRPPVLMQFDYGFRHVLGVDMGATHISAVAMDLQGVVVAHDFCMFDVFHNPAGAIKAIIAMANQVMIEAKLDSSEILGMGLATPAPLEGDNLDQLASIILPAWADYDLVNEIRCHFDFPIYLENDANSGAIAEKWWGQGYDYANLAYIKLGTGVGSGLIINNEIYRGDGGSAGEIGHTTINPTGPTCRCGNQGCMESFVGVPAIINEAQLRLSQDRPKWWSDKALTIDQIIGAALAGDPTTCRIIEDAGRYLGIAIANMVNLINPGLIVLGGDLVEAGDLLLNAVSAAVNERTLSKSAKEVVLAISTLNNDAIAIGAATLAMQKAFRPDNLLKTLNG